MKRNHLEIPLFLTILALFAAVCFVHLGDTALWQDEAETALLGRTTAALGYPSTDLGKSILFEGGHHANADHVWTWQTWLPCYLTAASFRLFGESAFTARLPFALAALLCVILTARLARSLTGSRGAGILAAFLLTANVPFLLYARQCRNYALVALLATGLLLAYGRFLGKRRFGALGLAAILVLLFHAHLLAFGGALAGISLHYGITRVRKLKDVERFLALLAGVVLFTLPWFLYAGGFDRPGQLSVAAFPSGLVRNLVWINNYLIPFAFVVVVLIAWILKQVMKRGRNAGERVAIPNAVIDHTPEAVIDHTPEAKVDHGKGPKSADGFDPGSRSDLPLSALILVPLSSVLVLSFCSQVFFRYLVAWIPLASVLLALGVRNLFALPLPGARIVAVLAVALLVTTNLWSVGPVKWLGPRMAAHFKEPANDPSVRDDYLLAMQHVKTAKVLMRRIRIEHLFGAADVDRCPLSDMIHELISPPRSAMDAIVEHLEKHAGPEDLVWTGYGDLPILFHTPARVVSWYMTARDPDSFRDADWILPRGPEPFYLFLDGKLRLAGAGKFSEDFPEFLAARFKRIDLPVTDILCGNCPDPDMHRFQGVTETPHVTIFRRNDGE